MNKFFSLTRVQLKSGIDPLATGKYSGLKGAGLLLLIMIGMIPFVSGMILATASLYKIYQPIGQEGIILALATGIVSILIFILAVFFIFNVYYFNSDIEFLLPLPLRPGHILGAKFTVTLLFEYLSEIIFLLPVLITYGIKSSAGPVYYIYSLIIFLSLPVIPLVMASVLTLLVMRFSNLLRNKDLVRIIIAVVGMTIIIGFNFYIQNSVNSKTSGAQIMELLNKGNNSLVPVISAVFPANGFASASLVGYGELTGLMNLAAFLVVSTLSVVFFIFLGDRIYLKGVIGNLQSSSIIKSSARNDIKSGIRLRNVIISLTLKEIKLLFRTPAWFFNCVLGTYLWPIFLIIFSAQGTEMQKSGFSKLSGMNPESGIIYAIITAAALMVTSMSGTASSSISREGSSLLFSKTIPVRYSVQLMAKILSGVILAFSGFVLMLIVAYYRFGIQITPLLFGLIFAIPAVFFASSTGVILDLLSPKLIWDNEYKPVKQNLNVVLNMILNAALAALFIYLAVHFELSAPAFTIMILLFFLASGIIIYSYIKNYAPARLQKINT